MLPLHAFERVMPLYVHAATFHHRTSATCESLGCTGGTLACDGSCEFDLSGCFLADCGNGVVDVGEQCDGADLNGFDCAYFGFSFGVGTLGCDGLCNFDTSGCVELCGNGVAEFDEQRDGTDLGFEDCNDLGFVGGTLACTAGCLLDVSACVLDCDYLAQDCAAGEGCYFAVGGSGGGCQPAGTGDSYAACIAQNDCAPGYYWNGSYCSALCDVTIGDAGCPAGFGLSCFPGSLAVSPNLGVCIPGFQRDRSTPNAATGPPIRKERPQASPSGATVLRSRCRSGD